MSFEEIFCFFYNHTAQGKKSDQVRECHQGIEDICDVPYSCYSHIWSDENADDVQPAVCCNCGFVSVEQVFQTSFTVVIPSEDCCECEEYQAQHQWERCYNRWERKSFLESGCCDGNTFKTCVPCLCDDDGKTCHGTDYDSVDKCTCHGYKTLTYRLLCLSCSGCDRGTTKTGLIGEDASGDTLLHSYDHGSHCATCKCASCESRFYDSYDRCRYCSDVCDHDDQCQCNIENCHKRYNDLGYLCDSPDSAENDKSYAYGKYQTCNYSCPGICISEKCYCVCFIRIKEVGDCRCDTVYLCKCSDTEKSNACSEKCEDLCKPSPLFSHTVFDVVEWSTENVAFFVNGTVLDCQKSFCVFGCHSEKCGYDHPEKCARSAGCDSSCNTYDISSSDGCWKRSTQSSKACDLTITAFFIFYHEFQCFSEMPYL